jgi:hypothetical protein
MNPLPDQSESAARKAAAILYEAMADIASVDWPDDARTYIARAVVALDPLLTCPVCDGHGDRWTDFSETPVRCANCNGTGRKPASDEEGKP